jgi:hypothetical protein
MSQHDYNLINQPGQAFRDDINQALAAIVSINAGAVEPTAMFPGMLWLDLASPGTYPNGRLRQRNLANSAWITPVTDALPLTGGSITGALTVSGLVTVTGGQIKFPAAQLPSSDVNTLDDYEETTVAAGWAATIAGTTTIGAGTYSPAVVSSYCKVGNRVQFSADLVWTGHTGAGNMYVAGLPFTASGNHAVSIWHSDLTFAGPIEGYVANGTTTILLHTVATGAAAAALPLDTAGTLRVSGSYRI